MRSDQATWASRSGRMRDQEAMVDSSFGADVELERLASAERFIGWIADEIAPHLGRRVLEVGAGIGSVSLALGRAPARRRAHRAWSRRPTSSTSCKSASATVAGITARKATSTELLDDDPAPTFDSVVYVNVLEHILDDERRAARPRTSSSWKEARWPSSCPHSPASTARSTTSPVTTAATCAATWRPRSRRPGSRWSTCGTSTCSVSPRTTRCTGCIDVKSLGAVSSTGYDRVIVPVSRALQRLVPVSPARQEPARHRSEALVAAHGELAVRASGVGAHPACHDDVLLVEEDLVRVAVDQIGEQLLLGRPTCCRSTTTYSIVAGSGRR